MNSRCAATGISYGTAPRADHASRAVRAALRRAGMAQAGAVVLFLTPEYAHQPLPAIRAAARAAGCTQVVGCTGSGILTEQEWIVDSPGAVAMVIHPRIQLRSLRVPIAPHAVLSLCTPRGINADWMDAAVQRIGAISTDALGQGLFSVWHAARIARNGRIDIVIDGAAHALAAAQSIRALTAPIEVGEVQGYDVLRLGNYPAFNVLVKSLPSRVRKMDAIPLHLLVGGVTFGDPETAISEGRYRLNHIVSADPDNRSITLAQPLDPGERLFWAMRDALASERHMRRTVARAARQLGGRPDFCLMFPCMARGAAFYGDRDRDIEALKSRFPGLPIAGFYANGEIGPLQDDNHLHQYSTTFGLFRANGT